MKKNLTKLALSGVALAAVAATLGTSTYAWYTANETVSATGISGASAGASDASIFISKDHLKWSSTVTLTSADIAGGDLLPVEYNTSDSKFYDLGAVASGTYTAGNERTVANGGAKKFTLYFRTSKIDAESPAPTVYLKGITLTNTTSDYTPADNLFYTAANGHGVNVNQATYGVDFTKALKMVVNTNSATAGIATTDPSYVAQNVNAKSWDLVNYQTPDADDDITENLTTVNDTENALTYYNAAMGTSLTASYNVRQNQSIIDAYDADQDGIALGTLKRDATYITVDFYIYLDGWDTYCYDACKGQSFSLDLEFTSKSSEALTIHEA
jgi:hypothetical protein